ncbi:hypothetical protein M8J77_002494 [Diaphorina citri]|nr:hypothetical protein M8J77_002494 [Diaphorina citri]
MNFEIMREGKVIPEMQFEGDVATHWKKFKQRFKILNNASEGNKKEQKTQISMLLHLMGEEGIELYNTIDWKGGKEEDRKLEDVLMKFDEVFLLQKNDLFEHYKFFNVKQKEGQSIMSYLKELKLLISTCNFKDRDILLRDKFIFGLLDQAQVEKCLRDPDITLDKAINQARAAEAASEEMKMMRNKQMVKYELTHEIDNVNRSDFTGRRANCSRCSRVHVRGVCPAAEEICYVCKKKGHYARNCFQNQRKKVNELELDNNVEHKSEYKYMDQDSSIRREHCMDNLETVPLYSITSSRRLKNWMCDIQVENGKVCFKLDSGSEVNIIPFHLFKQLKIKKKLEPSNVRLLPYGNQMSMMPLGKVMLRSRYKNMDMDVEYLIVDCNAVPLLGLDTCVKLNLIYRVHAIENVALENVTKENLVKMNEDLFMGLGQLPGQYHIQLKDNAVPVISPPRRVPFSIQKKLKDTLDQMEQDGIIKKVDVPTDWVSNMVIKEKKNGDLRICIDPKALNMNIKREHYALPTCEEIIQRLNGRSVFSVIDMKQGFWQVELDEESSLLCTFSTMYGRYSFRKAPFGLASVPEVFSKKVIQIFSDLEGVEVYFDDIIIAGKDGADHDKLLLEVLKRARQFNVKFNADKLQYRKSSVKFLGQIISKDGVRVDEEQVSAVAKMERPQSKKELMRFLGITKYLSKFIPNVSEVSAPLRELTKDRAEWIWSDCHQKSFQRLKTLICTSPVLRYFDDTKQLIIETDASKSGLGSCLLIEDQPVSFASRALTKCEQMYAQIEKELLAIVFATEKFHQFIYGKQVIVYSDHKPLMTIMKKCINDVPARLQRMLLRLFKYDLKVIYKPGSQMYISDALSRCYQNEVPDNSDSENYMVHDVMVCSLSSQLCLSEERRCQLVQYTGNDNNLQQLKSVLMNGWPSSKHQIPFEIRMYWQHRNEICIEDDLLFYNNRVIVPEKLRDLMLKEIHEGHLGIVKCKSRARDSLFWPSMNADIQNMIETCKICVQNSRNNSKEPLKPLPMPSRAWERIAADIFTLHNQDYLVLVDAYSMWIELFIIGRKSAQELIKFMKATFSRYGVPDILYSDNMPFNSEPYRQFAREWNFNLVFSSPTYSQSNGLAEKAVAICKNLLKKSKEDNTDMNVALLNYRNTSLAGMSYSPSELFFNRKLKTKLPINSQLLKPKLNEDYEEHWKNKTEKQKDNYNQHTKSLPELDDGDQVFMRLGDKWIPGRIIMKDGNPRSYIVESINGRRYRRNRVHLKPFRGCIIDPDEERRRSILDDDVGMNIYVPQEGNSTQEYPYPANDEHVIENVFINEDIEHYQPDDSEQCPPPELQPEESVQNQPGVLEQSQPEISNGNNTSYAPNDEFPPLPRRTSRVSKPPSKFGDYIVWPKWT